MCFGETFCEPNYENKNGRIIGYYDIDCLRIIKENMKDILGDKCKNMICENPKPYKNNIGLIHGLNACKKYSNVWNRYCNGATNIYKIAESHINKNIRPGYLCRGNLSVVLDDTPKSKFTRSEMDKPC